MNDSIDIYSNDSLYSKYTNNEFIIQEIDWSKWVPNFDIINTCTLQSGNIVYYMRSNSEKTLFLTSLYWAFYNFMTYIGYEPENPFLFASYVKNDAMSKKGTIKEKVYNRLEMYYNSIKYNNVRRKFLFLTARFFSNELENDYGFYIRFSSRTVDLFLFPHAKLLDIFGNKLTPNDFIYSLLLKIKYPIYIYEYNKKIGYLPRMYSNYNDLIEEKNKYKKWRF